MTAGPASPPRFACWLLAAVLPAGVAGRSTLGDLIEEFHRRPAGWRRRGWFWMASLGLVARYGPGRVFKAGAASGGHPGRWSRDVRYALRLLRRRPLYTVVSVLGLGVGLTATVTVFSFFNAAWGDPPGVSGAKSLAVAQFIGVQTAQGFGGRPFTSDEAAIALRGIPGFDDTAAYGRRSVTIQAGHETQTVFATFVSPTYFRALGTRPLEGRVLGAEDDQTDADAVVISARLAQQLFAVPREALGKVLRVADRDLRIVGVLPDRFARVFSPSLRDTQDDAVFVPLALNRSWPGADLATGWLSLVGRLHDGLSEDDVNSAIEPVARAIEAAQPSAGRVTVIFDNFLFGRGQTLWIFASLCLAAPVLLLIIGCANVANLRLAQATERAQEIAVRHSFGANRGDIVRLLVLESVVVSVLAMLLAWLGTHALLLQFAAVLPIAVPLDWTVAVFGCLAAAGVTVCSGLIPALLATSRTAAPQLKQSGQAGGYARTRVRHGLVVIQIALSVTLLTLGALFVRTVQEIYWGQPPVLEQIVVARIDLSADAATPQDPEATARFEEAFLGRLGSDPRVQGAGLLFATSLYSGGGPMYWLAGEPRRFEPAALQRVTPSWFTAMDLSPLSGRLLQPGDGDDVAVVNESLVASLGSSAPALGATLHLSFTRDGSATPVTIVGIVPDSVRVINRPLRPKPILYQAAPRPMPAQFTIAVRTNRVDDVLRDLPRTLADVEPKITWRGLETAEKAVERGAGPFTFFATVMAALGVVALVVSGVGLFAVTSYVVSLRTREFGVRMALGARKGDVVRLVIGQVGRLTIAGLAAGVLLTAPAASMLRFLFLGLSPADPLAIISIVVLLGGTTILAGILPARRAATIDPVRALRAD